MEPAEVAKQPTAPKAKAPVRPRPPPKKPQVLDSDSSPSEPESRWVISHTVPLLASPELRRLCAISMKQSFGARVCKVEKKLVQLGM